MRKFYFLVAAIACSFSSNAQNLVAHYAFDNCSAIDSSGNGLNLTGTGSPVCTTGRAGIPNSAYYFNGTSQWFTTPASAKLRLNQWTISAVVKFRSFTTGHSICQVSKIMSDDNVQGGIQHYSLETNDNNIDSSCSKITPHRQQFFGMSAGTPPVFYSYPKEFFLDTNVWYCLTAVYDGVNVTAYVDGMQWYSKTWPQTPSYSNNPLVYIGKGIGGTSTHFTDGIIDDLQIWDSVRNPADIMLSCTAINNAKMLRSPEAPGSFDQKIGMPFPNPAGDFLNIPVQNLQGNVLVTLTSFDGKELYKQTIETYPGQAPIRIATNMLGPGTYVLSVVSDNGRASRLFSKL